MPSIVFKPTIRTLMPILENGTVLKKESSPMAGIKKGPGDPMAKR